MSDEQNKMQQILDLLKMPINKRAPDFNEYERKYNPGNKKPALEQLLLTCQNGGDNSLKKYAEAMRAMDINKLLKAAEEHNADIFHGSQFGKGRTDITRNPKTGEWLDKKLALDQLVEFITHETKGTIKNVRNKVAAKKHRDLENKKKEEAKQVLQRAAKAQKSLGPLINAKRMLKLNEAAGIVHHTMVEDPKTGNIVRVNLDGTIATTVLPGPTYKWLGIGTVIAVSIDPEAMHICVVLLAHALGKSQKIAQEDLSDSTAEKTRVHITSAISDDQTVFIAHSEGVERCPLYEQLSGAMATTAETMRLRGGCTILYMNNGCTVAAVCAEGILLWVACQFGGVRTIVAASFNVDFKSTFQPSLALAPTKRRLPTPRDRPPWYKNSKGPIPAVSADPETLVFQRGPVIGVFTNCIGEMGLPLAMNPPITTGSVEGTLLAAAYDAEHQLVVSTTSHAGRVDNMHPFPACTASSFTKGGGKIIMWRDTTPYEIKDGRWTPVAQPKTFKRKRFMEK